MFQFIIFFIFQSFKCFIKYPKLCEILPHAIIVEAHTAIGLEIFQVYVFIALAFFLLLTVSNKGGRSINVVLLFTFTFGVAKLYTLKLFIHFLLQLLLVFLKSGHQFHQQLLLGFVFALLLYQVKHFIKPLGLFFLYLLHHWIILNFLAFQEHAGAALVEIVNWWIHFTIISKSLFYYLLCLIQLFLQSRLFPYILLFFYLQCFVQIRLFQFYLYLLLIILFTIQLFCLFLPQIYSMNGFISLIVSPCSLNFYCTSV